MNRQKRIMMLGGNYSQMTATLAAKREGYYVISVDYLPDNPAHKYADEYHNISTIDKEAILEKARELEIDGIVSYASDVSAPTAAFVSEELGLPTNPFESVMVMTHKDLFRAFMKKNGFPMPAGESFTEWDSAKEFFDRIRKPVIVKPIDSSGSKGVNRVDTEEEFGAAWKEALSYSLSGGVIVEEFIERTGYQIDGDIFVVDGRIRFWGIGDQHHDDSCSPYPPTGLSFPSRQDPVYQEKAREQIQRILNLLGMTMGAYNVEYIVGKDGEVYILEIGPRNGGNLISDAICAAFGVDLAAYTVRQAVGDGVSDLKQVPAVGFASSYILHAGEDGILKEIIIPEEIRKRTIQQGIFVKAGDEVLKFRNASFGIGMMVMVFEDSDEMCRQIDNMHEIIQVVVEKGAPNNGTDQL